MKKGKKQEAMDSAMVKTETAKEILGSLKTEPQLANVADAIPEPGHAQVKAGVSNTFDTQPPISKERLHELEDQFVEKMTSSVKTGAEAIELILKIRDERQYQANGYETFDAYMEDRWNYTRQWVEQMEKHLKIVRLWSDTLGISPDEARKRLTVYDATLLRPLQDTPDVLVIALKEAEEKYKATGKKSPKILKEVVNKWERYKRLQNGGKVSDAIMPTPEEFDLLSQLQYAKGDARCSTVRDKTLIEWARERTSTEGIALPLALDKVCDEERCFPPDEQLLKEARGEALKELIVPLVLRAKLWRAQEAEDVTATAPVDAGGSAQPTTDADTVSEAEQEAKWEALVQEAEQQNGTKESTPNKQQQYAVTVITSNTADLELIKGKLPDPVITKAKGEVIAKAWIEETKIDQFLAELGQALKDRTPKKLNLNIIKI